MTIGNWIMKRAWIVDVLRECKSMHPWLRERDREIRPTPDLHFHRLFVYLLVMKLELVFVSFIHCCPLVLNVLGFTVTWYQSMVVCPVLCSSLGDPHSFVPVSCLAIASISMSRHVFGLMLLSFSCTWEECYEWVWPTSWQHKLMGGMIIGC